MEPVIEIRGVSKKYSRNANNHLAYGMSDLLDELLGRKHSLELRKDEFWAVRDISLDLYPGDSLALVGRNGSGKTTLLKMLYGLIKPDEGSVTIRGNIQAIINLGSGFSATLSGRENIYTGASLVGLSKRETEEIVDEIVDFAELEEFIDSPVGTYSSGMKARLGFSVAVHLKPEILLIDEVLSVGDYAFQNKCFAKIESIKRSGTTIIFVSHSRHSIVKLCKDALWLHRGDQRDYGPSLKVVENYLAFLEGGTENKSADASTTVAEAPAIAAPPPPKPKKPAPEKLLYGAVYDTLDHVQDIQCQLFVANKPTTRIPIHSEVKIAVSYVLKTPVERLCSTLNFHKKDGFLVSAISSLTDERFAGIVSGRVQYEVLIQDFCLAPGEYVIMMPIADGQHYLWRNVVAEFTVESGGKLYFGAIDLSHTYTIANETSNVKL